jgi:hypothetical protein
VDCIVEEFGVMPAEVSPMRSTVINSASSTRGSPVNRKLPKYALSHSMLLLVQEQQYFYEESRRKIVGGALAYVEAGIERQRVELLQSLCVDAWTDSRNR